ncbi:DNA-binding protein [Streptomyces pluripotens]|uniref:DNA-binding protein n=1 Tax=Streptomyces pluripotens TaxID=1355015 RepID=A0A221P6D1_9ACTN|nr:MULTISPECIES: pyridoxamine 5'-phosphate oxidase family protein [Streptomyces]ARP73516.1 DNA-binding protein [Streptomyces pluripotens]ASN27767.1 DNA-binding protein [Streptomyces pluripotens]KIE26831.1 DNA-binding protein [Streptomyces sp. MUSC 125]MCH0557314.1 pyridoxamine 5'-phosphate oxidase family protein [Streptomyces sp. MUM 16J]
MAERRTPEQATPGAAGPPQGDLGRRIERRRRELGLTREETAFRAGMAPSYLAHLEEHSTAAPDSGTLLRLAGALRTSPTELGGGHVDLPSGIGQAARTPRLSELSEQECLRLLSTHGVGRLAVSAEDAPVVVPLNYSVVDDAIVFRTQPDSVSTQGVGREVAFEVDRVDDALSQGWSVLVRGPAERVTDPDEVRHLAERAYSTPWAGGERDVWMRIRIGTVTGRRIDVW